MVERSIRDIFSIQEDMYIYIYIHTLVKRTIGPGKISRKT